MTAREYFEQMYASSPDPWHLTDRSYERRKYELTIACLPDREFKRVYEPACSVGVLTELLVARCGTVIASDPVARAVELARERLPEVELFEGALPGSWPDGTFDLVVLSEVMYFLTDDDRAATIDGARAALEPGGVLISVNWRHAFDEGECDGDQVQRELDAAPGFERLVWHEERDFTIAVLERE